MQAARQPVLLRRLAAVGRRVAEECAADLREVDVGLAAAAALRPSDFGSRQPSFSFSTSWTCSATSCTRSTKSGMPSPSRVGSRLRRVDPLGRPSGRRSAACRPATAAPRAPCRRCGWGRASVGRAAPRAARNGPLVAGAAPRGQQRDGSATERRAMRRSAARRARIGGNLQAARRVPAVPGGDTSARDAREDSGLRIALAQIDPTVGDIDGNAAKIAEWIGRAASRGRRAGDLPRALPARLPGRGPLPEAALRRGQPARGRGAGRRRRRDRRPWSASPSRSPAAATSATPTTRSPCSPTARCAAVYRKNRLPNYAVFDEQRYFVPGDRAGDDRGRRAARSA